MPALRALVWLQVMLFLILPPFAFAAVLMDVRWLLSGIPWLLFCAFLNGWVQAKGLASYEESRYLPVAWIGGTDAFHLALLKFNAAVVTLFVAAILTGGLFGRSAA